MESSMSSQQVNEKQTKLQQSSALHRQQQAVYVKQAHKYYGSKKNPTVILDGLNMTVPRGTIYGLLGASGCGKTTLLSCIVGRKTLNSGELWVLGGTPGSGNSGVPGPQVGYMPQEIALYAGFTIKETLIFFAWLADFDQKQVEKRVHFLIDLLDLPDANQVVNTLSGGQQRRVSLASALVHEPELLILDEPTVGVDPLLRKNIWDHLLEITQTKNTTIIITTHYIDETKQANFIGLLRGGHILAEESPATLLTHFGVETLEEVFLKLSVMQEMNQNSSSDNQQINYNRVSNRSKSATLDDVDSHSHNCSEVAEEPEGISFNNRSNEVVISYKQKPPKKFSCYPNLKGNRLKALIWKFYLWILRNPLAFVFIIGLPLMQMSFFCTCIGHDPKNLPVAVVNYEMNTSTHCATVLQCNSTSLSCNYLTYLENRALRMIYYKSEDDARKSVLKGKTYAFILIKHNYSVALRARIQNWRRSTPWDIESSEIDVLRDISTASIAQYLKVYFYDTFLNFVQDYLESCKMNRRTLLLPVKIETPVYGLKYPNFTDFATPGIIITIIFFLAVALTAGAMITERTEGLLERALVSGVSEVEILLTHIVCQFMIMLIQSIVVLLVAFVWFGMTEKGSITLVVSITLLAGFCGMCFGFVVASVCDNDTTATYMAMGSLLPMMLLSGIVWPIQGMHRFLQLLSFALPLTSITESLRSVLQRGWGISKKTVYIGFTSITIWILIFLTISLLTMKFKKG